MAKLGRPRYETRVSSKRVIRAYQTHKTLRKTSHVLGCDVKTLKRVLKDNGVEWNKMDMEDMAKYGAMSRREGCFSTWLKSNPGKKLPCNMKEISEITGCSYDAVKGYLRRRKELVKELIHDLPDIRKLEGLFEDTLGLYVDPKTIDTYKFRVNKFSCDVFIVATLNDGSTTEIHIENIKKFEGKVKELLASN